MDHGVWGCAAQPLTLTSALLGVSHQPSTPFYEPLPLGLQEQSALQWKTPSQPPLTIATSGPFPSLAFADPHSMLNMAAKPPTDAFMAKLERFPYEWELGKATTDLTPAQKYFVAQGSVGRLIGQRVNRNNQRTGERDPWRYWGAGRRWAKQEAKGKDVDTQDGVEIWMDEESDIQESKILRESLDEPGQSHGLARPGSLDDSRTPSEWNSNSNNVGKALTATHGDHAIGMYNISNATQKQHGRRQRHDEGEWEFVRAPCDLKESRIYDGWDVVSISSASDLTAVAGTDYCNEGNIMYQREQS